MKKYEKTEMEIIDIKTEDIIQTSGDTISGGKTDFLPDWLIN